MDEHKVDIGALTSILDNSEYKSIVDHKYIAAICFHETLTEAGIDNDTATIARKAFDALNRIKKRDRT